MERRKPPASRPARDDPDDCFEAARRHYTLRFTCWACGHESVLHPAALWWRLHSQGRPDTFRILRQRAACTPCRERRSQKITNPIITLVRDEVTSDHLPLPSQAEWKRELERRRR